MNELLDGLDAMARDGWGWPKKAAALIRKQKATLKRIRAIGYETHPSWNCSEEFNRGWRACREQVDEELAREETK